MTAWKRPLASGALALALLTLWTLVCLRPIWRTFPDHISPDRGDSLFVLYVLKWSARQIRLGLPDLWNANFFYPTPEALAFSDHLLGPAAILALLGPVLPDAVTGYNLLFFASFLATGATTCWVVRKSGCSLPAALVAGGIFAFSPFRLMHANHLQMLWAMWIPLTLWHWDRLLAERTVRRAALFLLFYLLHVTGGCYLAYMIHVPLLAIAVSRLAGPARRQLLSPASLRVLLPVGALALAATGVLFAPYKAVSDRLGFERHPAEIAANGATLASYLAPSPHLVLGRATYQPWGGVPERGFWKAALHRSENTLSAGLVPTLLALYGLALFRRGHRAGLPAPLARRQRLTLAVLAALAVLAFAAGEVLTFRRAQGGDLPGPLVLGLWFLLGVLFLAVLVLGLVLRRRWGGGWPLRLGEMEPGTDRPVEPWPRALALSGAVCFLLTFPLVYLPLAAVVPGLDGMRVPARFYAFVSFSLAFFAARGIDALAGRARTRAGRRLAWGTAALLVFVNLLPLALHWSPIKREREFPEVYRWLAGQPDVGAIVEIPVRSHGGDLDAMYHSTAHWKPIANGYSGYLPPFYLEVRQRARGLPDGDGIAFLRGLGFTHLLVRTRHLVPRWQQARGVKTGEVVGRWEQRYAGREVALVHASGRFRVYRIL